MHITRCMCTVTHGKHTLCNALVNLLQWQRHSTKCNGSWALHRLCCLQSLVVSVWRDLLRHEWSDVASCKF